MADSDSSKNQEDNNKDPEPNSLVERLGGALVFGVVEIVVNFALGASGSRAAFGAVSEASSAGSYGRLEEPTQAPDTCVDVIWACLAATLAL